MSAQAIGIEFAHVLRAMRDGVAPTQRRRARPGLRAECDSVQRKRGGAASAGIRANLPMVFQGLVQGYSRFVAEVLYKI